MIDKGTAEHYLWGNNCDGWRLVNQPGLSVIQERMPPGAGEARHYHRHARQFFYVLRGAVSMELGGARERILPGQGVEIPPGVPHQIVNAGDSEAEFLVISQPSTAGDRIQASAPP